MDAWTGRSHRGREWNHASQLRSEYVMGPTPDDRSAASGDRQRPARTPHTPDTGSHDHVEVLQRRLQIASRMGHLLGHELRNVAAVLQAHSSLLVEWDKLDDAQRRRSVDTLQIESVELGRLL